MDMPDIRENTAAESPEISIINEKKLLKRSEYRADIVLRKKIGYRLKKSKHLSICSIS
jgi:hypothetical protein